MAEFSERREAAHYWARHDFWHSSRHPPLLPPLSKFRFDRDKNMSDLPLATVNTWFGMCHGPWTLRLSCKLWALSLAAKKRRSKRRLRTAFNANLKRAAVIRPWWRVHCIQHRLGYTLSACAIFKRFSFNRRLKHLDTFCRNRCRMYYTPVQLAQNSPQTPITAVSAPTLTIIDNYSFCKTDNWCKYFDHTRSQTHAFLN